MCGSTGWKWLSTAASWPSRAEKTSRSVGVPEGGRPSLMVCINRQLRPKFRKILARREGGGARRLKVRRRGPLYWAWLAFETSSMRKSRLGARCQKRRRHQVAPTRGISSLRRSHGPPWTRSGLTRNDAPTPSGASGHARWPHTRIGAAAPELSWPSFRRTSSNSPPHSSPSRCRVASEGPAAHTVQRCCRGPRNNVFVGRMRIC